MSTFIDTLKRIDAWAWIKARERSLIVATVVFQLVVLGWMVVMNAHTLLTGDTIVLRVEPLDPRDPLRGDYVILRYSFSNLWPEGSGYRDDSDVGKDIYISLQPEGDGKHWTGAFASWERPTSGRFIRGRTKNSWNHEFGIESYFVQEGQGKEYEEARNKRQLSAEIALTKEGAATLKRLIVE